MEFGIIGIIIAAVGIILLIKIIKFGLRIVLISIFAILVAVGVWIYEAKPDIQNLSLINVIESMQKSD